MKPLPLAIPLCFFLALSSWAADGVRVVQTPNGGSVADAEVDAAGTIHLVYDADNTAYYVRSTDGGATFSKAIKVVDDKGGPAGLSYSCSDMAVGKDGRVHVVLSTNAWKLKLPKEQWGLHYASLDSGAAAFTPVRNINKMPSEGYSVAVSDKGEVALFWLSGKLYMNLSRDGGKTFGANAEPDAKLDPCNCCTTRAAYGPDGKLYCLYREETNNLRDMYLLTVDPAGKMNAPKISGTEWSTPSCPMTYYAVTANKNGVLAAWPTKGDIYFARLSADAKVLPPGEIKTPGNSAMRSGVAVAAAPDGSALVAWKKAGRLGWQMYDAAGKPKGDAGSADGRGNGGAAACLKDGTFVVFP